MKKLLVVDDEINFLLSLADMFKHYGDQYALFTANNGKEALEVLNKEEIDLVVTDLKMPEVDGFALLASMTATHPNIPVIVMTAFATPENTNRLDTMGLYQFIEKPLEFSALCEKIDSALKAEAQGHIAGVSLASFLQLVGLDSKTCTLRITSGDRVGVYYFKDGELLDAICDELSGEEAAIEISGWNPVEIDIEETCRKNDKVIDSPLGFILIEGARRKDEKDEAAVTPPNSILSTQTTNEKDNVQADSQEFSSLIPKIKKIFCGTVGPVGDMLMKETLEKWCQHGPASLSRLDELVDLLCTEIDDDDLEHFFRLKIAKLL